MTHAPAAQRGTDVKLAFGLIQVPLKVYSDIDDKSGTIERNQFSPTGNRIRYKRVDEVTEQEVPYSDIVSKIATEHGPVYVEDHEIEALFERSPHSLTLLEFQPASLFHSGAYVPAKRFSVEVPKVKSGKTKVADVNTETIFVSLLEAMRRQDAVALVEYTNRGLPKPAVLLPDGTLWTLYHDNQVREPREKPQTPANEAYVEQLHSLMEAMWGDERLDLTDTRSAAIQELADKKAAAGNFGKPAEPTVEEQPLAPMIDLTALLAASVEQAKQTRHKREVA